MLDLVTLLNEVSVRKGALHQLGILLDGFPLQASDLLHRADVLVHRRLVGPLLQVQLGLERSYEG